MADSVKFCMGKTALKWVEFLSWLQMVTHASHALLIFLVFRDKALSHTNKIWELFVFFFFGFAMGLLLLRGAREKNRLCLTLWCIYAGFMILFIIGFVFVISERMGLSGLAIFIFIIPATVYGFSIWIVQILKSEITAEVVKAIHSQFVLRTLDPLDTSVDIPSVPSNDPSRPLPPPPYENYEPPTYQEALQLDKLAFPIKQLT